METSDAINGLPWAQMAVAGTQALIALTLVVLTWKHHSTQMRTQRALKVHDWGNECIDALAEADHFCLLGPAVGEDTSYEEKRIGLLRRLSALIDRGRMFFENEDRQRWGQDKLPAYQGFRPKILDPLVAAYLAIDALGEQVGPPDTERKERLLGWRRYFVSLLQIEINPEWLKKATKYTEDSGGGAGYPIDQNSKAPSEI
ncbi:MAG: hypothetical protein OXU42_11360 [Deltaproteobacteria bacterium]|nr:hypothetical protein [Deltaproteobacteria bacterium]